MVKKSKMSKAGNKGWITIYVRQIEDILAKIKKQSKKIAEERM